MCFHEEAVQFPSENSKTLQKKKSSLSAHVHLEFHFENNPSKVFVNLICARASPHPLGRGKCIQRETN